MKLIYRLLVLFSFLLGLVLGVMAMVGGVNR